MLFYLDYWGYPLLFAVGCLAGFINVIAGGGSLMSMPVMLFLGLSGPMANGSNRVAIFAQNVSATVSFMRHRVADFGLCVTLALCAVPGALVGASYGIKLDGVWFERILAIIILACLVLMLIPKKRVNDEPGDPDTAPTISLRRKILGCICIAGVGLYGGFIQAGVGFVLIAVLHNVMRMDLVRVNAYKVFIIGAYTIPALLVFALAGKIDWVAGIALAGGNSLGAWFGSAWAIKKGEKAIRLVVQIALVVLAAKLIFLPTEVSQPNEAPTPSPTISLTDE